ncbi:MAG: hypothetical protein IKU64_04220 [Bacteroides sp.]|nr:hypothetical protein [Bacteroides sp.]
MLYIAAMATAITACSGEESLAPEAGTPVTVSVTIPGDVWAVASRAAGEVTYTDWTLHYTDYKGEAATYAPTVTMNEEVEASFTTGTDLVWEQIDATKPIHLTCKTDNGTTDDTTDDYTLHVSVASATPRQTLAFEAMKPTVAKFTVNFTLTTNSSETVSIGFEAKGMADDYNPLETTDGAWPASDLESEYITGFETLQVEQEEGSLVRTVTGTILLPEQDMNPTMVIDLGSHQWTVDLSTVSVGNSGQKANQLKAGQHLTLNIKASYTTLNAPSIEVEAFEHATGYESELGGEAQQPSTNS